MKGRTWVEREGMRKTRGSSGRTAIRVTRATLAKLRELERLLPPFEVRGLDELLYELAAAEVDRLGVWRRSPRQVSASPPAPTSGD